MCRDSFLILRTNFSYLFGYSIAIAWIVPEMLTKTHRKKVWDIPKTQKAFKPLQEDEIKWLADRINSGNSTPQDLHAAMEFTVENYRELQKMSEMVCPIELRLEDPQYFQIRPRNSEEAVSLLQNLAG